MRKFAGWRAKTYIYLIDDGSEDKKVKGTKKCEFKKNINLIKVNYKGKKVNYIICLEGTQLENKINYSDRK